jgi:hypothetical protein
LACFLRLDPLAELRVPERPLELREQKRRDHELELAAQPGEQRLRRRAGGGKERGDDDVRVEYRSHDQRLRRRLRC